jgi:hypothetical protein
LIFFNLQAYSVNLREVKPERFYGVTLDLLVTALAFVLIFSLSNVEVPESLAHPT